MSVSTRGLRVAARRSIGTVAVVALFAIVVWWWYLFAVEASPSDWAFDFRQFWQGGKDVVDGVSPYPSSALLTSADDELGPEGIREVFRFPYPATAAVALAPFGLLSFHLAAAVWSALLIVSLLAAMRILGVKDWRVFAVLVTSAPVITSVRLGTFTPVLILLLAAVWRWRDRRWAPGLLLAVAISLKLFVWPVVVWLAATRRWREAGVALVGASGLTIIAWAGIGFSGMVDYPDLLRRLSDLVADRGLSLVALGTEAGLPRALADVLPWVAGIALLAGAVEVSRRPDGDRRAFSLAVVAALALTPIVWLHYFAMLVVPIAIARPRFAWVWLIMWGFWLIPTQENQGDLWRILVATALSAGVVASSCVDFRTTVEGRSNRRDTRP